MHLWLRCLGTGCLSNIYCNEINVCRFVLYCKLYSSSVVIVIKCFRRPVLIETLTRQILTFADRASQYIYLSN